MSEKNISLKKGHVFGVVSTAAAIRGHSMRDSYAMGIVAEMDGRSNKIYANFYERFERGDFIEDGISPNEKYVSEAAFYLKLGTAYRSQMRKSLGELELTDVKYTDGLVTDHEVLDEIDVDALLLDNNFTFESEEPDNGDTIRDAEAFLLKSKK